MWRVPNDEHDEIDYWPHLRLAIACAAAITALAAIFSLWAPMP